MVEATYSAAIVGLGFIGGADQVSGDALGQRVENLDGTHADSLQRNRRIRLVAGSSRDAGRRERFARRTAARTYADWREMLVQERPEIVSVATYAPQHTEITIACAAHGVRVVYCEKPLATRLDDAERMIAACRQAGTLLVVNHNRRFQPLLRRLREEVAAGRLGELTSASAIWGSGRLGNVGTHFFNALQLVIDRRVEAVAATLDLAGRPDCRGPAFRDPGGWGLLRFAGGLIATFDAADYSRVPATLTFNGTLGRAVVGAGTVSLEDWGDGRELWSSPSAGETSMDRAVGEIIAWLDRGGTVSFSDAPENSLHTLETIVACHASHRRSGAWSALPLSGADRQIEVQTG